MLVALGNWNIKVAASPLMIEPIHHTLSIIFILINTINNLSHSSIIKPNTSINMKSIIALTAALFLGATTMARPFTDKAGDYDICWLICASDKIQCPEGWVSPLLFSTVLTVQKLTIHSIVRLAAGM